MPLPMKVIQSIEFDPISEDYIRELLRKDIETQLPVGAVITKIEFARKLNPTRIEADVVATFGNAAVQLELSVEPVEEKVKEEVVEPKSESTPIVDLLLDDEVAMPAETIPFDLNDPIGADLSEEEDSEQPIGATADIFAAAGIQ